MNVKLLIDAIVQQTTVLIAQLSTAAGVRAPLAHVADQVFLELGRELEAQGVSRKVAADMFGLALRGYQKRMQRLTESLTVRERTLWEVVLELVQNREFVTRREVLDELAQDDPDAVASVLRDLVTSGLVYASGRGEHTVFRATQESAQQALALEGSGEALATMLLAIVYTEPGISLATLVARVAAAPREVETALRQLLAEGRITSDFPAELCGLRASTLLVPVDGAAGWEAAVFDHYQAMVGAIATKVRTTGPRSAASDRIGGATLTFDITDGHPLEEEVYGLLARVRHEVNQLWDRVCRHNEEHPLVEDRRVRVRFYFGQNVIAPEETTSERAEP